MIKLRKKLIEVALPLGAINKASAREKSIRHGHPSTLHLWWARRPLAAARAVIFAQLVDDPSDHPELFPTEDAQEKERQRLFGIIEELVRWENTTNESLLEQAREEIRNCWRATCKENKDQTGAQILFNPEKLPTFHDPFAGGGALPLEAQRLGLEAYASDLNPVSVLINKAMIEIPPKFSAKPPVNPKSSEKKDLFKKGWHRAQGLGEDMHYYGEWIRDEAEKRIGHLYPKVEITAQMAKDRPDLKSLVGRRLTVVAWIWARTVKSPNPAFAQVDVPLASTFTLSTKSGKEAYIEPVVEGNSYRFTVTIGKAKDPQTAKDGTKLARGANFRCLMSGTPISGDYIKSEGKAGRMNARMMAIVAEGERGRHYLPPTIEMEAVAQQAQPTWRPETPLPNDPRNFWTLSYGLAKFGDLFTPRQLVALTTFSDLVQEARENVMRDAAAAGMPEDGKPLSEGGTGATAYADAIAMYLSFVISKVADRGSNLTRWMPLRDSMYNTFARQALPMTWDFVEVNAIGQQTGGFAESLRWTTESLEGIAGISSGSVFQANVLDPMKMEKRIFSTDPPYYDNIGYADLSDFFYVWLRRTLKPIFPALFATLAVPKAEELVASPYRHGGKTNAEAFFLEGMTKAIHRLAVETHPAFPITIYYAFKQSETGGEEGTSSTGWETFLGAVIRAGLRVTGTWPIRTELSNRMIGMDTNALASSIVLVCRPSIANTEIATRREFLAALKADLPDALKHLQRGNIAPVDLAQAAIGPGMAVYTRYSNVLDASGKPLTVRDALALINQTLDEVLAEQEGDFDADSRWALAWFEHCGFAPGEYGVAEMLSKAKNTSIAGMVEAAILASKGGKVRLLRPDELSANWDPDRDPRLTTWEIVHQLIRVLESEGESAAGRLVSKLGSKAEIRASSLTASTL